MLEVSEPGQILEVRGGQPFLVPQSSKAVEIFSFVRTDIYTTAYPFKIWATNLKPSMAMVVVMMMMIIVTVSILSKCRWFPIIALIPVISLPRGTFRFHTFPVSPERCPPLTPQWEGRLGPDPPRAQGHLQEVWWDPAQAPLQAQPTAWWGPAQVLLDLDTPTLHRDPQDIPRTTCTRCIKYYALFLSLFLCLVFFH